MTDNMSENRNSFQQKALQSILHQSNAWSAVVVLNKSVGTSLQLSCNKYLIMKNTSIKTIETDCHKKLFVPLNMSYLFFLISYYFPLSNKLRIKKALLIFYFIPLKRLSHCTCLHTQNKFDNWCNPLTVLTCSFCATDISYSRNLCPVPVCCCMCWLDECSE